MIGFTGTSRKPLTAQQSGALEAILENLYRAGERTLGTGEAAHADTEANDMAREIGFSTRGYPSAQHSHRCDVNERMIARAPLVRDENIAMDCSRMIACPAGPEASYPRSGTWATIRRARKWGKPVTIIWPDGSISGDE